MSAMPCPVSVRFLGILSIVLGTSLMMAGFGTMMGAFSQMPRESEEVFAFWFTVGRFFTLGVVSFILAAGLLEGKKWGWFGALGMGLLAFLQFPIGTVLGGLLVLSLFRAKVRAYFRIGAPRRPNVNR